MKKYDVVRIREAFATLTQRANESLGSLNESSIGIGRYIPGSSPWERHNNGDELLFVTDGEVQIEVLGAPGGTTRERLKEGSLFVVPKGKWHQLTAADNVNILYVSPSDDGAERMRDHPVHGPDA